MPINATVEQLYAHINALIERGPGEIDLDNWNFDTRQVGDYTLQREFDFKQGREYVVVYENGEKLFGLGETQPNECKGAKLYKEGKPLHANIEQAIRTILSTKPNPIPKGMNSLPPQDILPTYRHLMA